MAWRISADYLNSYVLQSMSDNDKRTYGWTGDVRTMSATNFTNMFRNCCPYSCDGDDYLFSGPAGWLSNIGARQE